MERFYRIVNLSVMPLWLLMLLVPGRRVTDRMARSSGVFGVAALNYVAALVLALRGARQGNGPNFRTLDGLRQGLGTPGGALGAWAHMAAVDLFAGAWIYRQARRLNAPGWIRTLSLLLALFTGPLGVLFFLGWRAVAAGKGEALPGYEM